MNRVPYDRNARSHCDYDARVAEGTVRRQFGVYDRLNRQIGGIAYRWQETFVPAPEGATFRHCIAPGKYFAFEPHASRDGKPYGAVQRTQYYTDAASRDAAVERYFANARKRAERRG